MGLRISAAEWAELIAEWEASGRSGAAFAADRGVTESALRWWKTELARRARKEAPRRPPRRGGPAIALARVVREGERAQRLREPPTSSVSVVVGSARIVIEGGFDGKLLREVVEALGGRR